MYSRLQGRGRGLHYGGGAPPARVKTEAALASGTEAPARFRAGRERAILPAMKKKPSDQRPALLKDLHSAIKQLDEKGLLYLLRQAQVLVYNANVDRINAQAERKGRARVGGGVEPEGATGDASGDSSAPGPARATGPRAAVRIEEGEGGKVFFLSIGEARNVLSLAEIQRLVRICYGAESKSEALRQLFTLLKRERNDILFDARIGSPESPLLELVFREIRAKYHLKDR